MEIRSQCHCAHFVVYSIPFYDSTTSNLASFFQFGANVNILDINSLYRNADSHGATVFLYFMV